jgi:hypothetical protein
MTITRTRTRKTAAVIAAAAVIAGIVLAVVPHGGHTRVTAVRAEAPAATPPAPAVAAPVTPVTDVSGLRWTDYHGYRLPVSGPAGPQVTSGGLASGFADTSLGALVAMINFAARTAWQFGPAVFQPTIEYQLTGPYASQMLSLDLDAYGAGAAQLGDVTVYSRIVAYQWAGYTPSDATADLVEEADGADGAVIYAAIQVQAQWMNGDWRVVAPPGGDWGNSATEIQSLNGYLLFPGQEG